MLYSTVVFFCNYKFFRDCTQDITVERSNHFAVSTSESKSPLPKCFRINPRIYLLGAALTNTVQSKNTA